MKGFAVQFSEMERWDPSSFDGLHWLWPESAMKPIGEILKPRKQKIDQNKTPFNQLQPVSIHFDGSISKRKIDAGRSYTMDMYAVHPDDLIVAKIDLKNGAVAIAPDWNNIAVTGHFAVYEPDKRYLHTPYLHRLIQTSFFKNYLSNNKVGAEGRKEVKLDFFESIKIPLPPLSTQRAIVAHWDAAQADAATMVHEAEGIEREATSAFLAALGFATPNAQTRQRAFAVRWSEAERWGLEWHQQRLGGASIEAGKYPAVPLGELLDRVQYGTSDKANTEKRGVTVLRMNNIVDGRIDTTDLKHVPLPQEDIDRWRLKSGDILFNRTNSKELVGKCAVFDLTLTAVFASYLIRIVVDTKKADAHFIATIINGPVGRQQIDTMSRQIIGQANINSEELKSLRIPLPPLSIQTALVAAFTSARQDADALRAQARQRRETARTEVEAMILGRLPAPATTPAAPLTRPSNTHSRNGSGRKQKPLP
jgi:type I restriction enzyme S subunit